ncbi:hypothetical protein AB0G82_38570, partial [Streptomyces anulatus]|uniref:hypothetical protein n=1 Tax=Streptomyces anulatus TaxID=1892 RepID=UPI0034968954
MTGDRGRSDGPTPKRYPWQDDEYQPRQRRGTPSEHGFQPPPRRPQNTRPLPNQDQQTKPTPKPPRKLTVTRVAWFRTKQLSQQAVAAFR